MSLKKVLRGTALVGSVVAATAGYQWYQKQDIKLTQQPELLETTDVVAAQPSTLGLRATIPYGALVTAVNDLSATQYRDEDSGKWYHQTWIKIGGFKTKGPNWTIGYHWNVVAQRNGSVTIVPNGQALRISVPVTFNGQAGLRGDGAKLLKLHRKNFDGNLTAHFDVTLDLDENWCPVVAVNASHHWNSKPRVEVIDGIFATVTDAANDMLADQKEEVKKLIERELTCDVVRDVVAPHWRSWSVPIDAGEGLGLGEGVTAFLNVTPRDMAFSGLVADQDGVGVALSLTTIAELSQISIEEVALDLPQLQRAPWAPGEIRLDVPVSVPMDEIATVATQLLTGRDFYADTPVGSASVEVETVEVYQSGDRLVIGVTFDADVEQDFFSTSGTVYLSAVPVLDADTNEIRLHQVAFSRVLDNDLWSVVSAVFEGPIIEAISGGAVYDLSGDLAKATELVGHELNRSDAMEGVNLSVNDIAIAVANPTVSDGALSVVLRAEASVDATVAPEVLIATQ